LIDDNASEDSKLDRSIFFDKLLVDENDNYKSEVSQSELYTSLNLSYEQQFVSSKVYLDHMDTLYKLMSST